jgi:phospholipid/cholesterol/gamma-HCH transport system substrate-binding protein
METRASYVIVGGFVLALLLGLFLFVIWLTHFQLTKSVNYYRIEFHGSVTGLQNGSPVRYRGIPVGSVAKLGINQDNPEEIEVTIKVDPDTPVNTDTIASIEAQGLAGGVYIQLAGSSTGSPLVPKERHKYAIIKSREGEMQRVFAEAPEVMDNANQLIKRGNKVLSDENIAAITAMLDNLRSVTGGLADKGGDFQTTLNQGAAAARSLHESADRLNALLQNLSVDERKISENAVPAVADIRQIAEKLQHTAGQLDDVVTENRPPLRNFTSEGLFQLTEFLAEGRQTFEAITRLANKIEADPARFFFGNQQQGIPVR